MEKFAPTLSTPIPQRTSTQVKVEDNGQLGEEDVQILTEWAPLFFGISKEVTKGLVQTANKSMLQSKAR